jgi:hypothetical protein
MKWRTLPPAAICPTWFAPSSAKRAFALRNGTTEEQATALALLRQALTLDAGAGVKKEIDRLARVVKKPPRRAAAVTMALIAPMVAMVLMAMVAAQKAPAMLAVTQRTAQAKLQHRQIRR